MLMPFGTKRDATGTDIDFDVIYRTILRPAIEEARLQCIRADEERVGGIIHKPMFERLVLCDYAVADLTTANANVYYELGVRHAVRPFTTVLVFAEGVRLPFDLGPLRGLPYRLDDRGRPSSPEDDRQRLTENLVATIQQASPIADSPIFSLLDGMRAPDISRLKTDVFRDEVEYSAGRKEELRKARDLGRDAVNAVLDDLGDLRHVEVGVVVDLLLSFRAVEAHVDMVNLVEDRMGPTMQRVTLVREQYAFALNRAGRGEDAERVLLELIAERGPSSETYGLLGRVYKDRWEAAARDGKQAMARGLLRKAIDAYTKGFEADWRDAYPGINAVELMELQEPPDPRRHDLLPVVRYAAERRLTATPDYWDYATVLELAVLQRDEPGARRTLEQALAAIREPWEAKTTLASLQRLRAAADGRRTSEPWMLDVERELAEAVPPS
jgi:MAP3K TRAFs-binding domain